MHGLTLLAAVIALVIGVVALNRSSAPTHTATEEAAAKAHLCDRYLLASSAMHIATSAADGDVAIARISLTNGAAIPETATDTPALDSRYRDAALALANAHQTQSAMGLTASPEQYQSAMDETRSKDRTMQELCGE